jgi:hypothetical protein
VGGGRLRPQRISASTSRQRTFAVDWLSHGINHTAEPSISRIDYRFVFNDRNFATHANTLKKSKGHHQRTIAAKSNGFALNFAPTTTLNDATGPNTQSILNASDFNQQPLDADLVNGLI